MRAATAEDVFNPRRTDGAGRMHAAELGESYRAAADTVSPVHASNLSSGGDGGARLAGRGLKKTRLGGQPASRTAGAWPARKKERGGKRWGSPARGPWPRAVCRPGPRSLALSPRRLATALARWRRIDVFSREPFVVEARRSAGESEPWRRRRASVVIRSRRV